MRRMGLPDLTCRDACENSNACIVRSELDSGFIAATKPATAKIFSIKNSGCAGRSSMRRGGDCQALMQKQHSSLHFSFYCCTAGAC